MDLRGVVTTGKLALTATSTYNLLCFAAPAHQRVAIEWIGVYGDYNTAGQGGLLTYCRATSQGSSGTSITIYPVDEDDTETFQTTCISQPSSAPSGITAIEGRMVNPQLGIEAYWIPAHQIKMKGGGFFVVQFTPQSSANYVATARICE